MNNNGVYTSVGGRGEGEKNKSVVNTPLAQRGFSQPIRHYRRLIRLLGVTLQRREMTLAF